MFTVAYMSSNVYQEKAILFYVYLYITQNHATCRHPQTTNATQQPHPKQPPNLCVSGKVP